MKPTRIFLFAIAIFFAGTAGAQITWTALNGPNGLDNLPLSVSADGTLFRARMYIYQFDVSNDNGENWQNCDLPVPAMFTLPSFIHLPTGATYVAFDETLFKYRPDLVAWEKLPGFDGSKRVFADALQRLWKIDTDGNLAFSNDEGNSFTVVLADLYSGEPVAFYNDAHNLVVKGSKELYHFASNGQVQPVTVDVDNLSFQKVWFNPFTGTAFLLTDDLVNPLKKSVDGGLNWSDVSFAPDFPDNTNTLQLLFDASGAVWAITGFGILRTSDEGNTWSEFKAKGQTIASWDVQVGFSLDAQKVYVYEPTCGKQAFYRSLDYGANWTDLADQYFFPTIRAISKDKTGVLYAESCRLNNVETSSDEGQHWQTLTIETPTDSFIPSSVTVLPNGYLVAAGDGAVFRSTDGGSNWQKFDFQAFPMYIGYHFIASPDNKLYLFHPLFGPHVSADFGESWTMLSIPNTFFENGRPLHFHPGGNIFQNISNLTLINSYDPVADGIGQAVVPGWSLDAFTVTGSGRLLAVTFDIADFAQSVYISDDQGVTFQKIGFAPEWDQSCFLLSGPGMVLLKMNGNYYRSLDDGLTWELYFKKEVFPASPICFYFSPDNYLYAGLYGGVVYRTEEKVVSSQEPAAAGQVNVSAWPNPASSTLNLAFEQPVSDPVRLTLYDVLGRATSAVSVLNPDGKTAKVDISSLENGIYFYEIRTEQGRLLFASKVLKL